MIQSLRGLVRWFQAGAVVWVLAPKYKNNLAPVVIAFLSEVVVLHSHHRSFLWSCSLSSSVLTAASPSASTVVLALLVSMVEDSSWISQARLPCAPGDRRRCPASSSEPSALPIGLTPTPPRPSTPVCGSDTDIGCGKIIFLFPKMASIQCFCSLIYSSSPFVAWSIWFSILLRLGLVYDEDSDSLKNAWFILIFIISLLAIRLHPIRCMSCIWTWPSTYYCNNTEGEEETNWIE